MHAAILIFWLLGAQADEAPSADAKAKAQALLSEGTQFFNRGAMAEALDRFKQAYTEYASPKLLFNIGLTSRNLGRAVEAMGAFEQFLTEATDAPPEMIEEAKTSVSELRGMLGNLSIKCSAPEAEIALDGRIVGSAPLPNALWVMPGNHIVTAKHPDFSLATVTIDVNAGTVHTLTLTMQRVSEDPVVASHVAGDAAPSNMANAKPVAVTANAEPAADAANGKLVSAAANAKPAALVASSTDVATAHPQGWWLGRKWTWVAAATAVVLAGGAVVFGLSMQSRFDSLNQSCGSASQGYPGCSSNDVSSVTWRRNTANILWGFSAIAAVTAGALFMLEGHSIVVTPVTTGHATGVMAKMSY